ncbi:hypothetical protein BH11BAC2_BH11BAC2_05190 [soil metagenome]
MMRYLMLLIGMCALLFSSCKKEDDFSYGLNDVNVNQPGANKTTAKTTTEFISIAYADLFGSTISQSNLVKLNTAYNSFGDKKLIEDRIIRNFLNDTNLVFPTVPAVNGDTGVFISNTYKKFYNREANAFEVYYLKEQIRLNIAMNPLTIYYALMTSDEYRYY